MMISLLAISIGASLGAILRWMLGVWMNWLFPACPPGTLAANLLGGFLIGVALCFFASRPDLAPQWRLMVCTGFLGALTTFSTFSSEVVALMQQERLLLACGAVAAHVGGSLVMTLLGIAAYSTFKAKIG